MLSAAPPAGRFVLRVAKEDFKFSAAHFCAHGGGRERLHGHNYSVAVALAGAAGDDGLVVDFSEVKAAVRAMCA
jgi:6-pyruvoyl-tetrahydropterin synthase